MNGIKRFTRRLSFLMVLILAFSLGCKDNFESSIPEVSHFSRSINRTNFNGLYVATNPYVFNGGYGGIVIIYTGFMYSAFDVTCPYEVSLDCRIEVEASNPIATCPCCGTQYNLIDGSVLLGTGPGIEPLRPYSIIESGTYLIVSN